MTRLVAVRPSSVKGGGRCERRWAFQHIFRVPSESSPAAEFGTEGHAALDDFTKEGKPFDMTKAPSRAASFAKDYATGPGAVSECRVSFDSGEYSIEGTVDYHEVRNDSVLIQDYKFSKYKLSKKKLLTDPQFVIYGLALLQKYGVETLEGRWVYIYRDPEEDGSHDVRVTCVRVTYDELWDTWTNEIKNIVDKLIDLLDTNEIQPEDINKNTSACFDYGGCPFRGVCQMADYKKESEALESMMDDQSLWDWEPQPETFDADDAETPDDSESPDELMSKAEINPPEEKNFDDPKSVTEEPTTKKKSSTKKKSPTKKKTEVNEPENPTPRGSAYGFTLYLRCVPVGGDYMTWADFIAPVLERLHDELGVPHYSLVEYGAGKGHLSAIVSKHLGSIKKDLVVLGYPEEFSLVESLLMNAAKAVVAGVR